MWWSVWPGHQIQHSLTLRRQWDWRFVPFCTFPKPSSFILQSINCMFCIWRGEREEGGGERWRRGEMEEGGGERWRREVDS